MISRRGFLKTAGLVTLAGAATGGYAFGVEPFRLTVRTWRVSPPDWPTGLRPRFVVLTDLHACRPWMTPERIRGIVARANALGGDLIVLLGDYVAGHPWVTSFVHSDEWSAALAGLRAPLGVHAVLGNHDWWEDKGAQRRGGGPSFAADALRRVGIRVYENDAIRIARGGQAFWLAGLGDQFALLPGRGTGRRRFAGLDDLDGTLRQVTDDAPIVLMVHEPDIFPHVPARVSLTLAGHTHGGQVRLFGYSPIVPSRYGNRYAYGHIVESDDRPRRLDRNMIVSGGLGCSILPVRFGMPPEITIVDVAV